MNRRRADDSYVGQLRQMLAFMGDPAMTRIGDRAFLFGPKEQVTAWISRQAKALNRGYEVPA